MGILHCDYTSCNSASNIRDFHDWLHLSQITQAKKLFTFVVGCAVVLWTDKYLHATVLLLVMLWSLGHRIRGSHKSNSVPCMPMSDGRIWYAVSKKNQANSQVDLGLLRHTTTSLHSRVDLNQFTSTGVKQFKSTWVGSSVSWCSVTQDNTSRFECVQVNWRIGLISVCV